MTFLSPNALWLLFVLPLVYVFNVVKHRRLPVPAATLFIWKKVLDKAEAPRSSRKNLFNVALLLELLAVSAFVIALARPVRTGDIPGRCYVVVLDTSASMGARTENGKTRFEKALGILETLKARIGKNERDEIEILTTVGGGKAIEEGIPTDVEVDNPSIIPRKISGAVASGKTAIVITDDPGPLDGVLPRDTVIVGVGGTLPNVGIVSAVTKRVKGESNKFDVFIRLAQTGNKPFPGIEIRGIADGTPPKKIQTGTISKQGDIILARCDLENTSAVSIRIGPPGDSLSSDDSVSLWRQGKRKITFAIFGTATPSIMRAFSALEAEAITTSGGVPLPENAVPVYVGDTPKPPYPKRFICINPRGNIPGFCTVLPGAAAENAKAESKLSGDVDLRDFPGNPGVIKSLKPEAEAEVYVSAEFPGGRRPLIAKLTRPGETAHVIAFDPENTTWTETAGFPLYWAALAEDLASESDEEAVEFRPYRTGVPWKGKIIPLHTNDDESKTSFSLLSESETTTTGEVRPLPAELPAGRKAASVRYSEYRTYFILCGILLLLVESGMIMLFAGRAATGRR
jgi:hypothetical protein